MHTNFAGFQLQTRLSLLGNSKSNSCTATKLFLAQKQSGLKQRFHFCTFFGINHYTAKDAFHGACQWKPNTAPRGSRT